MVSVLHNEDDRREGGRVNTPKMMSRFGSALAAGAVATVLSALFSVSAFAQTSTLPAVRGPAIDDELKPHVGAIIGFSEPDGSGRAGGDFGVDIGFQPYIPFGFGLELAGSNNTEVDQTRLLIRGTYNFGGTIPVIKSSYVGAGIGPVIGSVGDSDRVLLGFAPMVGFDMPVYRFSSMSEGRKDYLTLGLHAKYLILEGSDPDALSANGVVKYWF